MHTALIICVASAHSAQRHLSLGRSEPPSVRSLVFLSMLSPVRFDLPEFILHSHIQYAGNPHFATAGGALGILASFGAYYGALSLFWTQQTTFSFIRLPPLVLAPSPV